MVASVEDLNRLKTARLRARLGSDSEPPADFGGRTG